MQRVERELAWPQLSVLIDNLPNEMRGFRKTYRIHVLGENYRRDTIFSLRKITAIASRSIMKKYTPTLILMKFL
jgi:hypothetical protein